MEMAKVKEHAANLFIKAFEGLSFDPDKIYNRAAQHYTLSQWRHRQEGFAGGAGGVAAIVPGLHIPALGLDIGILVNRMDECCYGIGTIIGLRSGKGNILEQEDLANILALWSGAITVDQIDSVLKETRAVKFGGVAAGPVLGKTAAVSLRVSERRPGASVRWLRLRLPQNWVLRLQPRLWRGGYPLRGPWCPEE